MCIRDRTKTAVTAQKAKKIRTKTRITPGGNIIDQLRKVFFDEKKRKIQEKKEERRVFINFQIFPLDNPNCIYIESRWIWLE